MSTAPHTPARQSSTNPNPKNLTSRSREKQTGSRSFNILRDLKSKREIMLEETGIWIVPLEHMEKLYKLPPWLDERMPGLLATDDNFKGPTWEALAGCFLPNGEAKAGLTEKTIYDHLTDLHSHVVKVCNAYDKPGRRPKGTAAAREYKSRERHTPPSHTKSNSSKPDAATLVNYRGTGLGIEHFYRWRYIMAVFEFKIKNYQDLGDALGLENAQQQMWNLQHMLWDNVDRQFSVGMTVEGTEARLWFACRAAVLASTVFDVTKDRRTLFRALAFFAFADNAALGQDPTMSRTSDDLPKVVIGNKRYVLSKTLSDVRARALVGSGCRVFSAHCINEDASKPESTDRALKDSPRVAIKDIWRDQRREPEATIYRKVLTAIADAISRARGSGVAIPQSSANEGRAAEDFFVEITISEDVMLDDNRTDDTETLLGDDSLSSGWYYVDAKLDQPVAEDDRVGNHFQSGAGMRKRKLDASRLPSENPFISSYAIVHRIRHRSVMPVVGVPLHEVGNLHVAFSALADVVHACRLMCFAGYNHRDLSTGNIIVDVDRKRGYLGDLEFAKLHGMQSVGGSIRTGTPDFMALEVVIEEYNFRPPRTEWTVGKKVTPAVIPLRHNAGHDLEAILWIAVFMLYNSLVFEPGDEPVTDDVQKEMADARVAERNEIFDYTQRMKLFGKEPGLALRIQEEHDTNRAVSIAIDNIGPMEIALKNVYGAFEAKLSDTDRGEFRNHEFLPVHDVFESNLRQLSELFKDKVFTHIGVRKDTGSPSAQGTTEPRGAKRQKLSSGGGRTGLRSG